MLDAASNDPLQSSIKLPSARLRGYRLQAKMTVNKKSKKKKNKGICFLSYSYRDALGHFVWVANLCTLQNKANESEFLRFIVCKNEPYVCFIITKTESTAQCPGCQSTDILNAVVLLLHFPVRCYKRLQKQFCLHTHTSTYLSSVLRSWNNLADKKNTPFFFSLGNIPSRSRFQIWRGASLASGQEATAHEDAFRQNSPPLQVISIWRSEWQEEQLSPAVCAEWIPGD